MKLDFAIAVFLIGAAATLGGTATASACADAQLWDQKPRQNSGDCSFSHFGADGNFSGDAVSDLGSGTVAQIVATKAQCPYTETLLVVDCATTDTVSIDGKLDPDFQDGLERQGATLLGGDYRIAYLQPPHGPLDLSKGASVAELTNIAQANGWSFATNPLAALRERNAEWAGRAEGITVSDGVRMHSIARQITFRAGKEYDPYCGCKLHYPESPGAMQ